MGFLTANGIASLGTIIENKYTGHWISESYLPEIYIEADGTVYAVTISHKEKSEFDPYSDYISSLLVGYCEKDNIIFTKHAKIYEPTRFTIVMKKSIIFTI